MSSVENSTVFTGENITFTLHIVDTVILAVYLVFSIGLGLYLSRKHNTSADYFLAGRSIKWPFIGLSLYASNISSSTLVGLAGDAYKTGISVYNYEWVAALVLIFFAIFYIPTVLNLELYTMPQFLESRFNVATRYYFSVLTIILNILGGIAGGLFSGALVMKMVFPQLEIWQTVAILAVIAGIYTISGGLAAVIFTDALQAVALLLGSVMISIYTLIEAGGWSNVRAKIPPGHLSLIRPATDSAVPWTGLISGLPLLGFYYWCCNQTIAQRVLSSKDVKNGRWGCLLAGLLKLPIIYIMVLPGAMARVIYPNLKQPDLVYPTLLFNLLPVGVLGIVLSGFIAALMSQIDSTLNSISTLVTMDFAKKLKPDLSERTLMNIGRFVTFIFMIISVCWAPMLSKFPSLFQYFQKLLSYLIPPIITLYLGGFFWKGANTRGAILALIFGNTWGAALFIIIEVMEWFPMHFLHVAFLLFFLSFIVLIVASKLGGKPSTEDQTKMTWSSEELMNEIKAIKVGPFWKNYILQCLLLVFFSIVIVGSFW